MYALKPLHTPPRRRVAIPTPGMIVRLMLALAAILTLSVLTLPSMARAGQRMQLRGDVTARGDVLTLGELIENVPAGLASRPLFRAPALGATGTIQAARILEAAEKLDLDAIETGGRVQISVQRAARRVGAPEIEAALKHVLQANAGLDAKTLSLRLDGEAPVLLAPIELDGAATAIDTTYDPRSRRFAALIVLGERQASLRVSGQVIEMRDVAVLTRAVNRGETIAAADLATERRPRETVPTDAQGSADALPGQVAQRALGTGSVLRQGDVAPPELVQRGEAVTIVFETPGVSLSLRGVASESGRMGSSITVVNAASKKVLQASVIGPGRVAVGPARPAQPIVQASAALDR